MHGSRRVLYCTTEPYPSPVACCRASREAEEPVDWDRHFGIGSPTDMTVHELKPYGIVCDFSAHPDVVGLVGPHQVCLAMADMGGMHVDER